MTLRPNYFKWTIWFISIFIVIVLILEATLRVSPRLIPEKYRLDMPLKGVELFDPGILQRTPIEGVPMPFDLAGKKNYQGPPPIDLVANGIASPEQNPDIIKYPVVELIRDKNGLPNRKIVDHSDIVLVGDSFALSAGVNSPPGLQETLIDRLNTSVYNLGIPSIGSSREVYMLQNYGIPLRPKTVIWLFFSGNDLDDEARLAGHMERGIETHLDLFPDYVRPKSLVFHTLKMMLTKRDAAPAKKKDYLSPFYFTSGDKEIPVWFYPHYLRNLLKTNDQWREHPGWEATKDNLKDVADSLKEMGTRFILVYVPTKPEIYLSHVKGSDALLHQMASFGAQKPLDHSPEDLKNVMLQNGRNLEVIVEDFANRASIEYISLYPYFEKAAREGILCYLSADTHWSPDGQIQAAILLIERIK